MMASAAENDKKTGGRPKAEPGTAFTVKVSYADMDFIDAAAKRLGVSRGVLIKRAVEAYVDPLARLQEAANASDRMRADMREMRSLVGKILDVVSRIGLFISGLYAAENTAKQEAEAESTREYFENLEADLASLSSTPEDVTEVDGSAVQDDDAMGWEQR